MFHWPNSSNTDLVFVLNRSFILQLFKIITLKVFKSTGTYIVDSRKVESWAIPI